MTDKNSALLGGVDDSRNDPDNDGKDERNDGKPGGPLDGSGLTAPTVAAEAPDDHDRAEADANAAAEGEGEGEPSDDVEELPRQPFTSGGDPQGWGKPAAVASSPSSLLSAASIDPTLSVVDTSKLTAAAMSRLDAILTKAKLTQVQYDRVQRCTARMIQIGVSIATASEKDKTQLLDAMELDLSTVEALTETKGIDVAAAVRNAAYLTVSDYARMGLQILAKYAVPAIVLA